jgi:hypothetical protein
MKIILIPTLPAVSPPLVAMDADQLTVAAVNKPQIARASQTIESAVSAAP